VKTLLKLVLLLLVAAAGYGAWYVYSPLEVRALPVEVEIPRGAGLRTALAVLEKAGVTPHRREFELLARALGKTRDIKAGNYQLTERPTPLALLEKLTRGDVTQAELRLNPGAQDRFVDRLGDEVVRASLQAGNLALLASVARQHNCGQLGDRSLRVLTKLFQDLRAIHARHVEVQQEE
jgi:cell division protein YceG involved in septum cleavage